MRKRVSDIGSKISKFVNPKTAEAAVTARYVPQAAADSLNKATDGKKDETGPLNVGDDSVGVLNPDYVEEEPIIGEVLNYLLSKMEIL